MARPPGAKARRSVWLNYGIGVVDVAERGAKTKQPGLSTRPSKTLNR
jgi:hypothetical protein